MRKISKCLLTLICCLATVWSLAGSVSADSAETCTGSCSHQAAVGTTHYDSLAEALAAATDGCTVTLLADTTSAALAVNKGIILDLGGKTLTGQVTEEEALLTAAKDITIKNGTMTAEKGTVLVARQCTVTIEKTAKLNAVNGNVITMNHSGKLEITGGEFNAKNAIAVMNIAEKQAIEASVTGGKLTAEVEAPFVIVADKDAAAPKDFVIGGTYNKLPEAFIPDYCRVDDNGDGTYTVTAEYSVSYGANGGSGTMNATKADRGSTITLPTNKFTAPAGKHFKAWSIGGKEFAPGASFAVNEPVALTAVWESHSGGKATCTSKAVCSRCGSSYGDYASHNYYFVSAYAATCTENGMNSHNKCSSCGQTFISGISVRPSSLTIPALGHQFHEVEGQEATCTEDGIAAHEICDICGIMQIDGKHVSEEDLVIPATAHTWETVPAVDATCTQTGTLAHEVCTVCGEYILNGKTVTEEELTIEMQAHVLSDWQSDETTHWKACSVCGERFRQHSHSNNDGDEFCDDCGYTVPVPTEMIPETEEEEVSLPFLIPVIVAAVIAVGGAVMVATKKKK